MTTLNINTDALSAAIKRVFPHAAVPSANTPVLECIRFETRAGYLIVSATDRFTLIESRVMLSEEDAALPPVSFLVNAKQLKALLPAFKTSFVVSIEPGVTNASGATFNGAFVPGDTGNYPATDRLWPDTFDALSSANIGLGVENVKKLAALPQGRHEKGTPLVFGQADANGDGNKPVIVLFGEDTRVLVMPVRNNGWSVDRWADWSKPSITAPVSDAA